MSWRVGAVGPLHGGGWRQGGGLCLLQAAGVQLSSAAKDLPAAQMQRAHSLMQRGTTTFGGLNGAVSFGSGGGGSQLLDLAMMRHDLKKAWNYKMFLYRIKP